MPDSGYGGIYPDYGGGGGTPKKNDDELVRRTAIKELELLKVKPSLRNIRRIVAEAKKRQRRGEHLSNCVRRIARGMRRADKNKDEVQKMTIEDKREETKKEAPIMLSDLQVAEVSLVSKPANKKSFLLFKSDDGQGLELEAEPVDHQEELKGFARIEKAANELLEADPTLTREGAIAKAVYEDPSLYDTYMSDDDNVEEMEKGQESPQERFQRVVTDVAHEVVEKSGGKLGFEDAVRGLFATDERLERAWLYDEPFET